MKTDRYFLLKIVMAIAACWLLGALVYAGARSHAGYCAASGLRLSEEQKIDSAIAYLLRTYPGSVALDQALLRAATSEKDRPLPGHQPIPYRQLDHFKRMNPDCCQVRAQPSDPDFPPAGFVDRLTGSTSSFVMIRYRMPYLTPTGERREWNASMTVAVSNCGESWSGM